jgi:hypothetical protein
MCVKIEQVERRGLGLDSRSRSLGHPSLRAARDIAEERNAVKRHLGETYQLQAYSMVNHPFSGHAQKVLVDSKVTCSWRNNGYVKTGSRQVSIDIMLVERIQCEVDGF